MEQDSNEDEISLKELIFILLKGKWIIIATTLIMILIAGGVPFFILKPVYKA